GQKDAPQAVMLFNQAQVLAMLTGVLFLVIGLATRLPYARSMAADARTAELAAQYLAWFVPAMALQFGLVAMGAALRAIGNFKTGMVVGTVTVILNMILAPFLIFGWGTGPFGAAAQAGFGIGIRIIQAGFMPVVALAFSVAPVAGQNFGARLGQRVKDTFKDAAWMAVALMVVFALACHLLPGPLVRVF